MRRQTVPHPRRPRPNVCNREIAQALFAHLSRGEHIVPLVGARRRDRLHEALGAAQLDLSADDIEQIEGAVPPAPPPASATPTR